MTTGHNIVTATKFRKFERLTAGFCMAIPFFLLVTDMAAEKNHGIYYLGLIVPILLTMLMPWLVSIISKYHTSKRYHGARLMISASIVLFLFYILFISVFGWETKNSISAYVTMRDSFVFGMVLAIGAMMFLAVGTVYFEENEEEEKVLSEKWLRKYINIALGVFLLLVIIFPCNKLKVLHAIVAAAFFLLCAAGTIRRDVSEKKSDESIKEARNKRIIQRFADYAPIAVMAYFMLCHVLPGLWIFESLVPGPITLFGAECIALWIVGVDFILVSLKRESENSV